MFTEIYLGNQHGSISKTISTLQNILKGTREIRQVLFVQPKGKDHSFFK